MKKSPPSYYNDAFRTSEFFMIAFQLCSALDHMNKNGIVHRYIKPDNVGFNPETKHVQLIDFGNAIILDSLESLATYHRSAEYSVGMLLIDFLVPRSEEEEEEVDVMGIEEKKKLISVRFSDRVVSIIDGLTEDNVKRKSGCDVLNQIYPFNSSRNKEPPSTCYKGRNYTYKEFIKSFKKGLFRHQITSITEVPRLTTNKYENLSCFFGWHGTSRKCTGIPGKCDFRENGCNLCSILTVGFKREKSRRDTPSFKKNAIVNYATTSAQFADFYSHGSLIEGKKALLFVRIFDNPLFVKKEPVNSEWDEIIISRDDLILPECVVEYEMIGYNYSIISKTPRIKPVSLKAEMHSGSIEFDKDLKQCCWSCCKSTDQDGMYCNYS
eukprot:TRINITY_DN1960_c0_g3_i1.p1 TRINITY_DN1960_c0_g3~~TRINITY_DN1960_c0_g3_i1.p1  ORF type:complete len:448 (+),score=59.69 TRINITY_DN1960_c0_g3_i1:202-1344(+)